MATKKKMLQAAAGSATGGAALDITDVFSTYLYEGNSGTKNIENGINLGQSNAGGSVDFSGADTVRMNVPSSSDFGYGTGDYTIEFFVYKFSDKNYITYFDQRTSSQGAPTASPFLYTDSGGTLYFHLAGASRITGSGSNIVNGAWTHVALCRASSQTRLFVNGTQIGSTYSDSTNYLTPASNWSVGGSLEQNLYNVEGHMSNVRVVKGSALYTSNFTTPTAALTAVSGTVLLALQGDEPFTDNSSSGHSLGNNNNGASAATFGPFDAAEAGEGGLVWTKDRTGSGNHWLWDTERGATKSLATNITNGTIDRSNGLTAFNSNGFTLGDYGGVNANNYDFASWTFRKAPKFFTCLTYTGTGPASAANEQQVSHDLGAKPGIVMIKRTDATGDWWVFTDVIDGSNDYGYLNQSAAFGNSGNNVATDSVFNVGGALNTSGATYVAYLFANNNGDGTFGPDSDQDIIKCGSFTGGSDVAVDVGFEPQFVLAKNSTGTGDWFIHDTMRGFSVIPTGQATLEPNTTDAEGTNVDSALTTNGFRTVNSSTGATYIYMAIRRGPLAAPTAGTEVFAPNLASGYPRYPSGFTTDFVIQKNRSSGGSAAYSRLQGNDNLDPTTTAQESASAWDWAQMTGSGTNFTSTGYIGWSWKRAPGYFDAVAYTGTGSARTVSHNLTVAPEMMWVKSRSAVQDWDVYHAGLNGGNDKGHYKIKLNSTGGESNSATRWNDTAPSASNFTVGTSATTNGSGSTYIAYLFASLPGISKVGSFTATGSALDIDCGFTSGARFVLVKRTDSTGDWFVFDSVRGITASTSPYLYLNGTSSESVASYIDPLASGFTVTTDFFGSGDFLFYAIA